MGALIKTIGSLFDPVLNFFQQVRDFIVVFFSFLWGLIDGLVYGFNTIILRLYNAFSDLTGLSFFTDNLSTIGSINALLGSTSGLIFFALLYCAFGLIIIRFIYSLIPFFKAGRK